MMSPIVQTHTGWVLAEGNDNLNNIFHLEAKFQFRKFKSARNTTFFVVIYIALESRLA